MCGVWVLGLAIRFRLGMRNADAGFDVPVHDSPVVQVHYRKSHGLKVFNFIWLRDWGLRFGFGVVGRGWGSGFRVCFKVPAFGFPMQEKG